MHRYEQHCPIARAAEVLTESWTLLVTCAQMADRLPTRAFTVEVMITDATAGGRWGLALSPEGAAVETEEPAEPPDVRLLCTSSGLAGVRLGRQSWLATVREQSVVLVGSSEAARVVLACVGVHRYAGDQRVPA